MPRWLVTWESEREPAWGLEQEPDGTAPWAHSCTLLWEPEEKCNGYNSLLDKYANCTSSSGDKQN